MHICHLNTNTHNLPVVFLPSKMIYCFMLFILFLAVAFIRFGNILRIKLNSERWARLSRCDVFRCVGSLIFPPRSWREEATLALALNCEEYLPRSLEVSLCQTHAATVQWATSFNKRRNLRGIWTDNECSSAAAAIWIINKLLQRKKRGTSARKCRVGSERSQLWGGQLVNKPLNLALDGVK